MHLNARTFIPRDFRVYHFAKINYPRKGGSTNWYIYRGNYSIIKPCTISHQQLALSTSGHLSFESEWNYFCEQKCFMFRGRIIKTATKLIMILRGKKENESKIEDKKMWRKTRTQCSNSPKHLCTTHLFLLRQSVVIASK